MTKPIHFKSHRLSILWTFFYSFHNYLDVRQEFVVIYLSPMSAEAQPEIFKDLGTLSYKNCSTTLECNIPLQLHHDFALRCQKAQASNHAVLSIRKVIGVGVGM